MEVLLRIQITIWTDEFLRLPTNMCRDFRVPFISQECRDRLNWKVPSLLIPIIPRPDSLFCCDRTLNLLNDSRSRQPFDPFYITAWMIFIGRDMATQHDAYFARCIYSTVYRPNTPTNHYRHVIRSSTKHSPLIEHDGFNSLAEGGEGRSLSTRRHLART